MSLPESLFGSWKLVSIYSKSTTGEVLDTFGEDPAGMLIYDPKGYVSVVMTRRGRSKFASEDMFGGSPEEINEAFESFEAYYGTFCVDADERTVTHHLEACRYPNWEGTDQVRHFELEGDALSLFTQPIKAWDDEWVVYVTWTRISSTQVV